MEKTFNIVVEETKNNVINALTESKLPATVVQMVLREILQGVDMQTQQIIQREKEEYQKSLKKEGGKNDSKSTGK